MSERMFFHQNDSRHFFRVLLTPICPLVGLLCTNSNTPTPTPPLLFDTPLAGETAQTTKSGPDTPARTQPENCEILRGNTM